MPRQHLAPSEGLREQLLAHECQNFSSGSPCVTAAGVLPIPSCPSRPSHPAAASKDPSVQPSHLWAGTHAQVWEAEGDMEIFPNKTRSLLGPWVLFQTSISQDHLFYSGLWKRLELMVLETFSNLNDSMIFLLPPTLHWNPSLTCDGSTTYRALRGNFPCWNFAHSQPAVPWIKDSLEIRSDLNSGSSRFIFTLIPLFWINPPITPQLCCFFHP